MQFKTLLKLHLQDISKKVKRYAIDEHCILAIAYKEVTDFQKNLQVWENNEEHLHFLEFLIFSNVLK